ncbi:alpha/beta hydrolase [uncultured Paludibaculum sp.]|uniref:alpha/beta hydrolase n=1 Tax=uncultured Paludibaculum sp. TaxID=1765020 RepID=UPI002AAA8F24|nr:alpha/beta hydrolase [uncultured Paludibaculum sp.]
MTGTDLGFKHRFVPGAADGPPVTLVLLHGTGGNEDDLIGLGRELLPGAALISPRGQVSEHGLPRFFRRLAEGVFDQEDLALRTRQLSQFVKSAMETYGVAHHRAVAVGYSNGANIASSILFTEPALFAGAILLRPMVPFVPAVVPDLRGVRVLLAAGQRDPIVEPANTAHLESLFRTAGASLALHYHPGGHELGQDDLAAARQWIDAWLSARSAGA